MKANIQFWVITVVVLLTASCVTTKKSKQDTGFIGKKYHDLTAKFNGYFNANELYKESILNLEDSHQDNYSHLLDIYTYDAIDDRSQIENNMDKAIEKVTKVAALHEPSKWVDDAYVLMGKAQYLKGDYETAQETFEYFIDDFNPKDPDSRVYQSPNRAESTKERRKEAERERKIQEEERKKENQQKEKSKKEKEKERKKEKKQREKERKQKQKDRKKGKTPAKTAVAQTDEKETPSNTAVVQPDVVASAENEIPVDPDEEYLRQIEADSKKQRDKEVKKNTSGGFLKHKPAYYEGMLWLVRTYIARDKWLDANYYLERLENDEGVPEKVLKEIPVVRADLMIKQKSYTTAIPALEKAIDVSKDRKFKARLAFIAAQIHQINGNSPEAYAAFDRVNDFKPDYEMSLNARLNQLRNSWSSGSNSSDEAIKQLLKFTKQDKNRPYLGSIYFTMAEIKLAEGDEQTAFEFFNLALANSSGSGNKVDIYYRLASLFLGRERYLDAKTYYDSTLTVMQQSDERHPIASRYSKNLTSIAKNLTIIMKNDSLLNLGSLPEEELMSYARERALKSIDTKEQKKEEERGGFTATTTVLSGNSKFFAYNPTAIQRGRQDFLKRWGDRSLEDDWRRSSKSSNILGTEIAETDLPDVSEEEIQEEINRWLRNIPRSEEDRSKSLQAVEKASFELGTGYRTYIENFLKSNQTLLLHLERFPDTEKRVEAYFYLYLNYLDLDDSSNAQLYLDRIMNDFPDSEFAKYLADPTGDNVLMTEERKIEVYYQQTYDLFENKLYEEAFGRLEKAKDLFGSKHKMIAKYDLLKAMCIGNLKGKDDYINALRGITLNHTNTPEQTYAREMLRFLRGDSEAMGGSIPPEALENYVLENDKLHYIIIIVYDASGPDINEVKKQIDNFNVKYHKGDRLRSTSIYLNQEKKTHLVLIRRFNDKENSMNYLKETIDMESEYINGDKFSFEILSINQKNYREVIKEKSINTYRAFFEANY